MLLVGEGGWPRARAPVELADLLADFERLGTASQSDRLDDSLQWGQGAHFLRQVGEELVIRLGTKLALDSGAKKALELAPLHLLAASLLCSLAEPLGDPRQAGRAIVWTTKPLAGPLALAEWRPAANGRPLRGRRAVTSAWWGGCGPTSGRWSGLDRGDLADREALVAFGLLTAAPSSISRPRPWTLAALSAARP